GFMDCWISGSNIHSSASIRVHRRLKIKTQRPKHPPDGKPAMNFSAFRVIAFPLLEPDQRQNQKHFLVILEFHFIFGQSAEKWLRHSARPLGNASSAVAPHLLFPASDVSCSYSCFQNPRPSV